MAFINPQTVRWRLRSRLGLLNVSGGMPHLRFVKRATVGMAMQKEHQRSLPRPNEVQSDSLTDGVPIAEFGASCRSTSQKGKRESRASCDEQGVVASS
jgi:hypothetical protein